jgi:hypothetical protein
LHDRGHESLRRMAYAGNVLEAVGQELDRDNAAGPIRAAPLKALSPILVRQLKGVLDAYGPSIQAAIAPGADLPTIVDITCFYLKDDPLDPKYGRVYRRNIIYSREALWHLAVTMGTQDVKSREDFMDSLETHDLIMEGLKRAGSSRQPGIPTFNEVEVNAIVRLQLEEYFDRELKRVVCAESNLFPHFSIISIAPHPSNGTAAERCSVKQCQEPRFNHACSTKEGGSPSGRR